MTIAMIAVMLLPVIIGSMLAITPKEPPYSKLTKRRLRTDAGVDGIEVDGLSPTGKAKQSYMHPKLPEQQRSVVTIGVKSPNNVLFILILLKRLVAIATMLDCEVFDSPTSCDLSKLPVASSMVARR
jgi:hypothetical protein